MFIWLWQTFYRNISNMSALLEGDITVSWGQERGFKGVWVPVTQMKPVC